MLLSIIIKTYNEEAKVSNAIESALEALKRVEGDGEIILADSASTDRTIEFAQNYPIQIVQIKNKYERSCGIGGQLGFLVSKGSYVYILDGDMILNPSFIVYAIDILNADEQLAGVAGIVEEKMLSTHAMALRNEKADTTTASYSSTCLNMGGLYRRKAIEQLGYFTNRNLHSFEEFELGIRLINNGWRLTRINIKSVEHYGPNEKSLSLIKRRWDTNYAMGNGELFKSSLGKPYFIKVIKNLRVYRVQLFTIIVWFLSIFIPLICFNSTALIPIFLLTLWLLIFLSLLNYKKSVPKSMYSIVAWHVGVLGFIKGLIKSNRYKPTDDIDFIQIN